MLEKLNSASFMPYLNQKFTVQFAETGVQELELIAVDDRSNKQMESFSLIFTGQADKLLPQQIHCLKNEQMGEVEIFITPIQSTTRDSIHYQAVFNRLL